MFQNNAETGDFSEYYVMKAQCLNKARYVDRKGGVGGQKRGKSNPRT